MKSIKDIQRKGKMLSIEEVTVTVHNTAGPSLSIFKVMNARWEGRTIKLPQKKEKAQGEGNTGGKK